MTWTCKRCQKTLSKPPREGYGPRCAEYILGPLAKPERISKRTVKKLYIARATSDDKQMELELT